MDLTTPSFSNSSQSNLRLRGSTEKQADSSEKSVNRCATRNLAVSVTIRMIRAIQVRVSITHLLALAQSSACRDSALSPAFVVLRVMKYLTSVRCNHQTLSLLLLYKKTVTHSQLSAIELLLKWSSQNFTTCCLKSHTNCLLAGVCLRTWESVSRSQQMPSH